MRKCKIITVFLLLILFAGCGGEEVPETTTPVVPYSSDLDLNTRTYVDIVAIEPVYIISLKNGNTVVDSAHELVCTCVTTDGELTWVFFDRRDYVKYIDPDSSMYFNYYDTYDLMFDTPYETLKEFDEPIRLRGTVRNTDAMCAGLSEEIGQETIVEFLKIIVAEGEE